MVSNQSIANEKDVFFLERLDAFIDKTLLDAMRSFAIREQRPLEQVRTGTQFPQFLASGLSFLRTLDQTLRRGVSTKVPLQWFC